MEMAVSNKIYGLMQEKGLSKTEVYKIHRKTPLCSHKVVKQPAQFHSCHPCQAVLLLQTADNNC